jgi:hypothetical protein
MSMKFSLVLILSCAIVALCGCSGSATSDEDRVRELLASAEQAAEERDVGDVLEFVDAQYADTQGNTRDSLALFLRAYFATHPRLEIVTSIDDLQFPVDGLARVRMKVRGLELDRFNVGEAVTLDVELRRAGGKWLVVRADRVARE